MRILVAVDQNPYSAYAVDEVAKLARNTLANVTLLGVMSKKDAKDNHYGASSTRWNLEHPLAKALRKYRENFLSHFGDEDSPYLTRKFDYELLEVKRGIWEELCVGRGAMKDLKTRIRLGNPVKETLMESQQEDSDLIVLGCSQKRMCVWADNARVPQKIANDATCSVLVAKEGKKVKKIVCCLDHDKTSQQSLEMINQMVTLHQADLELVGITEGESLRTRVEKRMHNILEYYIDRQINPLIKLVPLSSLESFISEEAQHGLMALWMGKKSILEKVLSRNKVNRLIKAGESSVLMLR